MSLLTAAHDLSGALLFPSMISTPGKGQNKTTEKLIKSDVGMVGRLKLEIHKGIKEQGNSKAKFLKQMPGKRNSKGYFLLVESQIEKKKDYQKTFIGLKQSQSCRNTEKN